MKRTRVMNRFIEATRAGVCATGADAHIQMFID